MGSAFQVLHTHLPAADITVTRGTIIDQYPQKLWLADDLLSLPVEYL